MVAFDGGDYIFAMTPSRVSREYNKFHKKTTTNSTSQGTWYAIYTHSFIVLP
jgi:hypothetical protein